MRHVHPGISFRMTISTLSGFDQFLPSGRREKERERCNAVSNLAVEARDLFS
jgi:hypothetical protein